MVIKKNEMNIGELILIALFLVRCEYVLYSKMRNIEEEKQEDHTSSKISFVVAIKQRIA